VRTVRSVDEDPEEAVSSRRPALRKLTEDLTERRRELRAGFGPGDGRSARRNVLEWLRKVAVHALGEVPMSVYSAFGREFRRPGSGGPLLEALLVAESRTGDLYEREESARELRRRLDARVLQPAYDRAFQSLRNDAGEYVGETEDPSAAGHNPAKQRYIAMRPTLNEIEVDQRVALERFIAGFDDETEILEWGDRLEHATHGEPVVDSDDGFVTRAVSEPGIREVLLGNPSPALRDTLREAADSSGREARDAFDLLETAREGLAAYYLLPAFNRGVRDLVGRTGEEPGARREHTDDPTL
jgi:hypothetical protein